MKKFLVIGLVIVLALSLGAGAVFAGAEQDAPSPNILVTTCVEAVAGGVLSNVTIANIGILNATVTSVNSTVYWQEDGDDTWSQIGQNLDVDVHEIAVGSDPLELSYPITCTIPEDSGLLKNEVLVEVDGTDEVFEASATLEITVEEEDPEIDEPEDEGDEDTGGKKEAFRSGNSHCWHFTLGNGASGRLNCQIKDGNLTGVFNGKGLEAGVEYCLSYDGACLGSATANKAGKVHIKAEGQDIEDPTIDNLSLEPCETE